MTELSHLSGLTPTRRLMRLLRNDRREIRYVILYAVVIGIINLSLPLGIQAIIGLILGGSISASWGVLVFFILVGAAMVGILRLMQLSIMENLQRQLFAVSAMEFAARIPRLNLEYLRKEYLPELVNRFFDTLTLQKGLPKILIDGSTALLQIVLSMLLLSVYHVSFVVMSGVLLLVLAVLFYWTSPLGIQTSLKESKNKYKLAYWLEEVGRVASTFKLAGENRFPMQRADELTMEYLYARHKHWRILLIQMISSVVFRVFVLGGFIILGSLMVMNNEMNIGQFVAAEILVLFIIESVEKLILLHETGYDLLTATEKLGQVTDLPLEREGGLRVEEFCDNQALEVELRDLSYQYDDGLQPVLQGLNIKIPAGQRLLIAGYNASGKSTLMQILSVVKRDYNGLLLFNGLNKSNLDLRSLREHIGDFSSQEDLFKGSFLENITLGRPYIDVRKIVEVCEQVGLTEFIRQLPDGIQTELLPGGKNVPGNSIIKILVARAIINNPNLLVMEDPLGNLRFRDRLRIAQLLTDKSRIWTFICTSEDPLLASMCERVIVLRAGQVVFDGTFDEVRKTEHFERIFRTNIDQSFEA